MRREICCEMANVLGEGKYVLRREICCEKGNML